MKGKLTGIVLRLTVVMAMLFLLVGAIVQPALADATINQSRDPSPANYVLNDGSATELMWWEVQWTSTPIYLSHIIENPLGAVVHTDAWNITGSTSPIWNPEDPTGVHYGDNTLPAFAHSWLVPAGAVPGTYTSRVRYYSSEVSGGPTVPPADLGSFEAESAVTFFVRQPWQIFKYNDLNGNGAFNDPPEVGLDNWNFTVTGPVGTTPFPGPSNSFSGSTSGGGFLVLPEVAVAGAYTITETLKSGWRNTDPGGSSPYQKVITIPDDLDETQAIPTVMFGNQQLGSLEIFKFNDLSNDGIYDAGEPALSGWNFTITGPGGYSSSGLTNGSGLITRNNLLPGNYEVTEITQAGWTLTTLNPQTKAVTAGNLTRYEFGNNAPVGSLQIFKFKDANQDGVYNSADGDTPLEGWVFGISGPGGYSSSGTTDSSGLIDKVNLVPGDYTVTEIVKPNWICTTANPQTKEVKVNETTYYEFGNYQEPPRVPASSGTSLWILIGGLGAAIALFGLWRTRRSLR